MKLLLDSGNNRVKWAYASQGQLFEFGSANHRQTEWIEALPVARPDSVWLANVAGQTVYASLQAHAQQQWGLQVHNLSSVAQSCGVTNAYSRPERLGIDRWLACIAGFKMGEGAVLIADAGTALTLDYVSARGQHKGGLISPGIATMQHALLGETRLRPMPGAFELTWLADDTDPAVALGSLQAVRALLENARSDLAPARCVITGGEAELLLPHLDAQWQWVPHLVLEGLNHVAESLS